MPRDRAPDIALAKALGDAELDRRATSLRNDSAFRGKLIAAFEQGADERDPWPHVEQQIYDAFISNSDELLLDAFHSTLSLPKTPSI